MATYIDKQGVRFEPSTGSGNTEQTVLLLDSNKGGRVAQQVNVVYTAPNIEGIHKTFTIEAAPEFISFTNGAQMAVSKDGGSVTVEGTSNSSKITFSLGSGTLALTLSSTYSAAGLSTNNGALISGDPGAVRPYNFSITFTGISENATISELTRQVIAATTGGKIATINLVQAQGDTKLIVTPSSVTIPQSGRPVLVNIECNTNWNIQ